LATSVSRSTGARSVAAEADQRINARTQAAGDRGAQPAHERGGLQRYEEVLAAVAPADWAKLLRERKLIDIAASSTG